MCSEGSVERHKMDYCKCEETGLDLEESYSRVQGMTFRVIAELKDGENWQVKLGRRRKK